MSDPRERFVELVTEFNKKKGLGALPSKLIAELYIEPGKLSLDELSEKTGYSTSAISGEMKNLVRGNLVKRTKEPGSKKLYFYMEKSLIDNFVNNFRKKHSRMIDRMKNEIPEIIEEYEEHNDEKSIKEKEILEKYFNDLLILDDCFNDFVDKLENIDNENIELND